ncbi:MAG: YebC/PmpR family DNA-binding transcriptional regulator [Oscillospiraceae bacterium]
MSGHSKWSTIKRKKGEKDGARAKVFTKISREILVCIKETGSADPANNSKLATLVQKAKSNNIPNDNIDRLLKKAAGGAEKNDYENCVYEGYGPGGVAVIVDCLTDNRNRTAGEVRHYFDKFGGNMGTSGCVSFMFSLKGVIVLNNEDGDIDEDKAMEDILEAGGEDFSFEDGVVEISTDPSNVGAVAEELTKRGYEVISAQAEQVPSTYTTLTDEDQLKKMGLLLEMLDDNDDVQNVWHNWDAPDTDEED